MKRIWSRSFFPVLLAYFIDNFGLAIVYPIFTPLFLRPHFDPLLGAGVSLFTRTVLLGLLIASFPLAQLFGAPFIGDLADRIGRKKVLYLTVLGGGFGYFLTGIGVQLEQIEVLWTGRMLSGFFAGNYTLCLAAVADITHTKKQRIQHFGAIGAVGGIAFVLAIFTGGILSFSPSLPFHAPAALCLLNLFLLYKFYREPPQKRPHDKWEFFRGLKKIAEALVAKSTRSLYFAYFLFMLCWFPSLQFLSTYLIDEYSATQWTITLVFLFIGCAWALANFALNPFLSKKFEARKIFKVSLFLLAAFLLIALIPDQPLLIILGHFALSSLFAALAWTSGLETIATSGLKGVQKRAPGINQTIVAIATLIGPLVGGLLAASDIHRLYLFTATCGLLGVLFLFFARSGMKGS